MVICILEWNMATSCISQTTKTAVNSHVSLLICQNINRWSILEKRRTNTTCILPASKGRQLQIKGILLNLVSLFYMTLCLIVQTMAILFLHKVVAAVFATDAVAHNIATNCGRSIYKLFATVQSKLEYQSDWSFVIPEYWWGRASALQYAPDMLRWMN